jgi:hypothetical protein
MEKKMHITKENHWYYFMGNARAEIIRIPGHGYKSIVNDIYEKEHRTLAEAKAEVLSYSEVTGPDFYA